MKRFSRGTLCIVCTKFRGAVGRRGISPAGGTGKTRPQWFSYKPVFPQKNLQTKFDKAMASRILKTYPVIWAIAASCLAAPSLSSYTGFGGGEMLEQNRQNAYAKGAGTARA